MREYVNHYTLKENSLMWDYPYKVKLNRDEVIDDETGKKNVQILLSINPGMCRT